MHVVVLVLHLDVPSRSTGPFGGPPLCEIHYPSFRGRGFRAQEDLPSVGYQRPGLVPQHVAYSVATQDTGTVIVPRRYTSQRTKKATGTEEVSSSALVSTSSSVVREAPPIASLAIPAPYVVMAIQRNPAVQSDIYPIVTSLRPEAWRSVLLETGLFDEFSDVVLGITHGFSRGIGAPVPFTRISANHPSAHANADFIDSLINVDIANGRYSKFYDPLELESLIGPFFTSPLAVVIKADSGKRRLVQNHSFPRNSSDFPSVNSFIDASLFKCDWGTFTDCFLIVARAPPGTQASIFDVDSAFRNIPSLWSERPFFCISWKLKVIVDHVLCFGDCSAPGIFGRVADAICKIYLKKGIEAVLKWVDDFVFFRYASYFCFSSLPY